ncbi:MAG TPA: effector binding domain-containing protein [Paenibacillus sp.]|uniref:GyrI-like domain-containing protein n=1 Tax=Paenibacillus sp. TaxID=58172 RepID=UPI0028D3B7D4|nr:effector binding domain-containing protein [Paenibacillus sp.]HUC93652.1 effector binding domain-containing protein [Paenibacillus sp.]
MIKMEPEVVALKEMRIGGVYIEATEKDCGPQSAADELWRAFRGSARCFNKEAEPKNPIPTYVVYTEYNRSEDGKCTIMIGHEVTGRGGPAGDGCRIVRLPKSHYAVFTTRRGPALKVTAETWRMIDVYFAASSYRRRYTGDFELYDARASDPDNAVVDIYVAVE